MPDLTPILPPVPTRLLRGDVAALGPQHLVLEAGEFRAFVATAPSLPHVLPEIGRLREITFRAIGEGSGLACDVDRFDGWYEHLFLWDDLEEKIVGAYRIGYVPGIASLRGLAGLYTATLFRFSDTFFDVLGPCAELGRSFVRPEYQSGSALWILWRGIGQWLARTPACRHLMGPVSIDRKYRDHSIHLMATHLESRFFDREMAGHVEARVPFVRRDSGLPPAGVDATGDGLKDLERWVRASEPDGRGIPILLRHYLGLGGRVLGLNVDPHFSDVVDALVVVTLDRVEPHRLTRFMGPEATSRVAGRKAS
jgi:putative hemolysin